MMMISIFPNSSFDGIFSIDCDDGDIRLSGGGSTVQGTVQICYSGTWGLIADGQWDNLDAQVVCRQLGYSRGN